jgi:hypothetical protein
VDPDPLPERRLGRRRAALDLRRRGAQYQTRILPALRPIRLPEMERATGLSNATCSRVRRGLQIPNPRHWAALANLAGLGN